MTFEQWLAQSGWVSQGNGLYSPANPYSESGGQAENKNEATLRDEYYQATGQSNPNPSFGSSGKPDSMNETVNIGGRLMRRIGESNIYGNPSAYDPTYGYVFPEEQYKALTANKIEENSKWGPLEYAVLSLFALGGGLAAGGYGAAAGGAAEGVGGAAGALPESYWSTLASGGAGASDAGAIGAGTVGGGEAAALGAGEIALPGAAGGLPSTLSTTLPSFTQGAGALSAADVAGLQALGYSAADITAAGGGAALSAGGFGGGAAGGAGGGSILDSLLGGAKTVLGTPGFTQLAGAGLSALSAANQASAARDASSAQQAAAQQAIDEQRRQFDLTRSDTAIQRDSGNLASLTLRRLLGIGENAGSADYGQLTRRFGASDLAADPVYNSGLQFGLDEGRNAINARAIGSGMYDSGATLKALTKWGNDYGSTKAGDSYNRFNTDQGNIYNRLAGVSGAGQVATGQTIAANQQSTNNIVDNITGAGNARAAGIVGGANAWGSAASGINSALNNYTSNELLKKILENNRNNNNNSTYFG